jgi:hypothetical protein
VSRGRADLLPLDARYPLVVGTVPGGPPETGNGGISWHEVVSLFLNRNKKQCGKSI